jgi:AcrR family transcriptional regulator
MDTEYTERMTNPGIRRASYGPTSPTVGQRGARTRERIVTETLALFSEMGFNETSVRDISEAAHVSRATLYQYFESKEEIFIELLEECGGQLLEVMRRIGPLGPTAEGFENLRRWLVEWTEVYDKYGTLFVQWANVDLPRTGDRTLVSNFLRSYNLRIANRFRRSGLTGMDPRDAAIVTTSIIHRFNYLRFVSRTTHAPTDAAVQEVTVLLQSILFPDTPVKILRSGSPDQQLVCLHTARRSTRRRTERTTRVGTLTPRSALTVRRIMDAGAQCFAESGYFRANVDDIVKTAGFARGTFYKYFDEKLDLLLALSDECEDRLYEVDSKFADIAPGKAGRVARREWLNEYLDFRVHYIGVMRTWIERSPRHPALEQARERVTKGVHETVQGMVETSPLAGVVGVRAAEVMLIGLLERLPDAMADNARRIRQDKIAELIATVIERGLYRLIEPATV